MCNISLPSNGTGSHHPGSGETGQEISGGERWQGRAEALALRSHPCGPGNLDSEEWIHAFLCHFHQQIIPHTQAPSLSQALYLHSSEYKGDRATILPSRA